MLHLLTRGLLLLGFSLAASTLCALLMIKYNEKTHNEEQERQEGGAASYVQHRAAFLPLETFGLDYGANTALRGTAALLHRIGPALPSLAEHTNESLMVAAACLPVGLYYLALATMARVAPEVSFRGGMYAAASSCPHTHHTHLLSSPPAAALCRRGRCPR